MFAFACYVESPQLKDATAYRFRPIDVHVLVCGDYVLTLHRDRMSLPEVVGRRRPEGRIARITSAFADDQERAAAVLAGAAVL